MKKENVDKIKGVFVVPAVLFIVLIPFGLIGWNILTSVIYWLIIAPGVAIVLPTIVSEDKHLKLKSVLGLILFYAFMVFMIYDHYRSDQFIFMMGCLPVSLLIVYVASRQQSTTVVEN